MRTLVAAAVACLSIVGLSQADEVKASIKKTISIPAQGLRPALQTLSKERDVHVVFVNEDVSRLSTQGASGELSLDEALKELLEGTGLTFEYLDQETVSILPVATGPAIKGKDDAASAVKEAQKSHSFWDRFRVAQADTAAEGVTEEGEATTLQEIVVTAQRREERTIDVPMSITAISGEKLSAAGINNASDLSFVVPSLSVSETTPGQQVVVIRGIGSQRGSSSLTGIYLDEMPVTGSKGGVAYNAVATDLRTIDLERVEVLKGPQGTLFGEGAAGGVIRFITKDPDLTGVGGSVSTKVSNTADGGWSEEIGGVINLPIVKDVLGIRIAALYEDNSGWIDQPATEARSVFDAITEEEISFPGSAARTNINDSEIKHVRVKALYVPTPRLEIKGLAEIHRNRGGASNFVNLRPLSDSNFVQAFERNAPTDYVDDYDAFNLTVTYDFGFAQLLSSTSRLSAFNTSTFTQFLDGEPDPWLEILSAAVTDSTIFSQEFRLTSAASGPFTWSVGASYKDNDFDTPTTSGDNAIINLPGIPDPLVLANLGVGFRPVSKSESWAAFAEAGYKFDNGIEVGGGLRQFHDKRESFDALDFDATFQSDDFDKLTFRTYVRYQATDAVNLYLNAASGFRSGGFNGPGSVALGAPVSFGPEETRFYEAGSKMALWGGRMRLDAAIFYGEYQGMQEDILIPSPVDPEAVVQYTNNGQDAEVRGAELELSWRALENLTLTLAGDVTDTEITRIDPANQAPAFRVGDPISFVPKYGFSVGVDYRFHWSDAVPGFVLLSFDRQGKSYMTARANDLLIDRQVSSSKLSFLNASIGGNWNSWSLSIFGRNLLDEDGLLNAAVEGWTAQARPRTVGVTLAKEF